MPRIARIVGVGSPHHIVQRGNNRENVFLDLKDYEKYLSFLARYSEEKDVAILAYCLMPNHVHLLIIPSTEKTLAYQRIHPLYQGKEGREEIVGWIINEGGHKGTRIPGGRVSGNQGIEKRKPFRPFLAHYSDPLISTA